MKVALIIGHSFEDKGAVNKTTGIQEFDYNERLVERIHKTLSTLDNVESEIVYRSTYSGLPTKVNATNADIAIEFHANAHNTLVSGTEMLYWHTSKKGKQLANLFQYAALDALGLSNRGVKAIDSARRGGHLLQKTRMPTIICEPFFIDNDDDLHTAQQEFERLAERFVVAISEYASIHNDSN